MHTSRRDFLKAVGAIAVGTGLLGTPAVMHAQTRKGVPAEPVKIGILAIRAGVAAPVGAAGLRGVEWWTERANKNGAFSVVRSS
jgi:ABC-type branched-subunit amino acid transport system substrate-binding protein